MKLHCKSNNLNTQLLNLREDLYYQLQKMIDCMELLDNLLFNSNRFNNSYKFNNNFHINKKKHLVNYALKEKNNKKNLMNNLERQKLIQI